MSSTARTIGMLCLVSGVIIASFGTGAVSSVLAPRDASIAVADNSSSYLEISLGDGNNKITLDQSKSNGKIGYQPKAAEARQDQSGTGYQVYRPQTRNVTLGTVSNRFSDEFSSVEITIEKTDVKMKRQGGGLIVHNVSVPKGELQSKQTAPISAYITCGPTRSTTPVTLHVEATGEDTEVKTTRTVEVTCPAAPMRQPQPQPAPQSWSQSQQLNGMRAGAG